MVEIEGLVLTDGNALVDIEGLVLIDGVVLVEIEGLFVLNDGVVLVEGEGIVPNDDDKPILWEKLGDNDNVIETNECTAPEEEKSGLLLRNKLREDITASCKPKNRIEIDDSLTSPFERSQMTTFTNSTVLFFKNVRLSKTYALPCN